VVHLIDFEHALLLSPEERSQGVETNPAGGAISRFPVALARRLQAVYGGTPQEVWVAVQYAAQVVHTVAGYIQGELGVMKLRQHDEPQGMAAAVVFGEGIRQVPTTTRLNNSFLIPSPRGLDVWLVVVWQILFLAQGTAGLRRVFRIECKKAPSTGTGF
jgi:hypothetical protein